MWKAGDRLSSLGGRPIGKVSHGGRKYLWGNMPALDLLRLEENEGADTTEDLRLLFAVTCRLAGLPPALTLHQHLGT